MAEAAVSNLLGRLSSTAMDEINLLGEAERELNETKAELEFMRSFLQDADARGETDERVKTWVKQVRDVAYDAEDILDEYYLRLVQPCNQGIFNSFLNCHDYFKQLRTRHSLATEMKDMKMRIRAILKRSTEYGVSIEGSRVHTTSVQWHDPRITSRNIVDSEIVGIEVPKNVLIRWLTGGDSKCLTLSVVGMGGLGKTTLVKKVYDSEMVKQHFDCHVWITVSQSPVSTEELLRTTIRKVLKDTKQQAPEDMDTMDVHDLIQELDIQLSAKRYVIIFDDIWDINVWEAMRFAFPHHEYGSRIIFTTRIDKVAAYSDYSYALEPLEEQEAYRLFCMKVFGTNHDSGSFPEELEVLSKNILKKCGGLPLAIVLIGGLLRGKPKTVWEWKNVHDSVGAEMTKTYNLNSLSKILLLSYNDLPYFLKPCFMYLSMFPEDYFIKRMTIIRMWIAEGFVEEKQGVTLEVVAGEYVNEFFSRSMIQVAEFRTWDSDEIKSYRIHDLMRETIQSKCKEECFSTTIIGSQGKGVELHEKARRISIYHNNTVDENYNNPMGSRCSHIRSILMFQLDESRPKSFGDKFFRAIRLLRVLDLEGADIIVFPPGLVELIHLRYLSLRSTKITLVPNLIGKLKNLETLDLKNTRVYELPVGILKLQRLRHLFVYRYDSVGLDSVTTRAYGVSVPTGIRNLTSLQKLAFLDVQSQAAGDSGMVVKELGKLTQLRRLGITNLRSKDGRDLCLSLQKMEQLHSLEMIAKSRTTTDANKEEEKEFLELESLESPPQLLRHMYLKGSLIRLPVWIAKLRNLTNLGLRCSRLSCEEENDPLKAFQHMPNLVFLQLSDAYNGDELCCSEVGGYQNLKQLDLLKMEGLKRVRFVKGSMPMLMDLDIAACPALEMVPRGIEYLRSLQILRLFQVNLGLVERIMRKRKISASTSQGREAQAEGESVGGGEDWWRVQHIQKIFHIFNNIEGTMVVDNLRLVRNI